MSSRPTATGRRIAILVTTLKGGGVERVTLKIASGLLRRGHKVDLVLEHLACDYPDEVPRESRIFYLDRPIGDSDSQKKLPLMAATPQPLMEGPIRVSNPRLSLAATMFYTASWTQVPLVKSKRLSRWAAGVAAYLDRERPDALLARLTPSVAAATMATHLARHRVRIVGTLHAKVMARRSLRRARCAYPHVDAAVGVSRGVASELTEVIGVPVDRVHTIYNPVVSEALVRNSHQPAGHRWLDDPGPRVILAAGRLSEQKDFPTLLTAFAKLREQCPTRLIVLGKGHLRPVLESLAKELRIAEHVEFPGFVRDFANSA